MTRMKRRKNSKNNYLKNLSLMLKGAWWMKNFSSLPNKHRGAVGRLEGQKMLYFQRTEADISSQCFQRYSSHHSFVIRLQLKDKTSNIFSWFAVYNFFLEVW
jgi:hypothetical protein